MNDQSHDHPECYDADYRPIRCFKCGSVKFTEITKDRIENTVCEYEVRCAACITLVGYWGYGSFDPEFAVKLP